MRMIGASVCLSYIDATIFVVTSKILKIMENNRFLQIPALCAGLPAILGTVQGAGLEVGFQATIGSEQNALSVRENGNNSEGGPYFVSVHPDHSGYAAIAADLPGTGDPADSFQRPFSGPVLGWYC